MLLIERATRAEQLNQIRSLLEEYGVLRKHDAALGDYQDELKHLPGKYGPPDGTLLLATWDAKEAGCVALRNIGDKICEMKRMYVSPDFRAKGIGKALVIQILEEAKRLEYEIMRLDTHPWMHSAQKIYQSLGFVEVDAYNNNPTPGIRFFERRL